MLLIFTIECINHNGKIFTKFKNKMCKILNTCYSMKGSAIGKNYGSIVIPKAWGVWKSLFSVRRPNIQAFVCLILDKQFAKTFLSSFCLCPGHKNNMEEKNYLAIESDGANFILVEDWICKLWLFIKVPVGFFPYSLCTNQFFCYLRLQRQKF